MNNNFIKLPISILMLVFQACVADGPPRTTKEPVVDNLHGTKIIDSYRWLESKAEVETVRPVFDERVVDWLKRQTNYSRSILDRLPRRRQLENRYRELSIDATEFFAIPIVRGKRTFILKQTTDKAQPTLFVRLEDKAKRMLVDPAELDPSGMAAIAWFEPSADGALVAIGLIRGGDEDTQVQILETASGRWLPDKITGRVYDVRWTKDASGFFYNALEEPTDRYSRQIRFHSLGQNSAKDQVLFDRYRNGPGSKTWGPFAELSPNNRWLTVGHWTDSTTNDLYVIDLDRWRTTGVAEPREILVGQPNWIGIPESLSASAVIYGDGNAIVGDTLFATTNYGAGNKRIVAIDLQRPEPEHWRELVAERKDAVLQRLSVAGDVLVAEYLWQAQSRVELFDLDGRHRKSLELPGLGTARVTATRQGSEAIVSYESFASPPAHYRIDLRQDFAKPWQQSGTSDSRYDLETKQIWYPSTDGTQVSLFIVHRRGLTLDGNRPVLLTGYGGFGFSQVPTYLRDVIPWLEAGGIVAIANLRGGSEYGDAWHRAGMLENKQNVFDDFIAAAEWLIKEGYTKPKRLGIMGASNGGLLMGAVLTQRPDLFAAVYCDNGLLDMLRYHRFLRAANWIPEFGSSDDPEQFAYLKEYSPYHNVKPDTVYPAVMFYVGLQDARVHPLHGFKMTARLQAVMPDSAEKRLILLVTDEGAGHGLGRRADKRLKHSVDVMSFFMAQLGVDTESENSNDTALNAVRTFKDRNGWKILKSFADLLSIPNHALDLKNITANANWIRHELDARGIKTELVGVKDTAPLVYGELTVPGATRTIGLYIHYDGQPVVVSDWASPPFTPVLLSKARETGGQPIDMPGPGDEIDMEWRLYARSAGDDKAPIPAILAVLDAFAAAGIDPTVNLRFLLDGEEEIGSPHFTDRVKQFGKRLNDVDLWLVLDGPVHSSGKPQVVFGFRGAAALNLTVYGPNRELHSGHYGNWAPVPGTILANLLASFKSTDGTILIKGFYDSTAKITKADRDAINELPDHEDALRRELGLGWTEGGGERRVARVLQPSLTIRGLSGGTTGLRAKNAVPTHATASIEMRLTEGNDPDQMLDLVEAHIKDQGFEIVRAEPDLETRLKSPLIARVDRWTGFPGVRTSLDLPLAGVIIDAVTRATGTPPLRLPSYGGSLPIYSLATILRQPILIVPMANHDNNQHGPNENIRIKNLWLGIDIYAALLTIPNDR